MLVAAAVILAHHVLLLKEYVVTSASMEPTLHCTHAPGCRSLTASRVLVSAVPYLFGSPARGDVVVIDLGRSEHECAGTIIIKRIVALSNDVVEQRRGRLVVRTRLGHDQFFVRGDNRSISCDSREFGPIYRSQIVGKVVKSF